MAEPTNTTERKFTDLEPEEQERFIQDALKKDIEATGGARTDDQAFADRLIGNALSLRETQRDLNAKVSTSREMLRGMRTLGQLTDTQATAVDLIYPARERKPKPAVDTAAANQNGNDPKPAAKPKPAAA